MASLHAVTEGTHTLLPIPGKTSPSDLPHCCIAEVGYVGSYGCDGCQKKKGRKLTAMLQIRPRCVHYNTYVKKHTVELKHM